MTAPTLNDIITAWDNLPSCHATGPGTDRPHMRFCTTFYRHGQIVAQWYVTGCPEPLCLEDGAGRPGTLSDLARALGVSR